MKIAIASDHGGYDYKQELIPYIESLGHQVLDLGCHGPASVDLSLIHISEPTRH